ncbi:hypothetical protein ACP4OV_031913 [Aristida adscensionis]
MSSERIRAQLHSESISITALAGNNSTSSCALPALSLKNHQITRTDKLKAFARAGRSERRRSFARGGMGVGEEGIGSGLLGGGIACCAAAAGCYLMGKTRAENAAALRSARTFCRISDLSMTLGASSGYLPLVTVSGRVGSETPLIGQQSGLNAAIVKNNVTQHFLKKQEQKKDAEEYVLLRKTEEEDGTERCLVRKEEKDDASRWIECSELISSKTREVPWHLDDGTGRLKIVRASSAEGFVLSFGSEVFEKQPRSCGCECSVKILGLKRTEWVLPIRAQLTVVGEAVEDDSGKILIRRPRNGGPFHVTRCSIDNLISGLEYDARWYEFWAAAFAASGVLLLGGYAMC